MSTMMSINDCGDSRSADTIIGHEFPEGVVANPALPIALVHVQAQLQKEERAVGKQEKRLLTEAALATPKPTSNCLRTSMPSRFASSPATRSGRRGKHAVATPTSSRGWTPRLPP